MAIDGPAASGKSTTARSVAEELGYCHLNSGLLYRAIGWVSLRDAWSPDGRDFAAGLSALGLEMIPDAPDTRVRVNGEEPGEELRAGPTAVQASVVARREDVRQRVLATLRDAGRRRAVVCDGRDIGTIVFPQAELKVFLVASPEERARRRLREHGGDATPERVAEEAGRLLERDARDSEREIAPLRKAPDAVELDTTLLTPEQVVGRIVALAVDRGAVAVDGNRGPV